MVTTLASGPAQQRLSAAAAEFSRIVKVRNDLVHSNPATAPGREQWLNRRGDFWTPELVDIAADDFAANGIELNDIFHNLVLN
jgi:hypothetical protein